MIGPNLGNTVRESGVSTRIGEFTSASAPRPLPVLGHARQFLQDPVGFLRSLPALGDLVEIRLGPQRAYVVCHPELVWQMLRDDQTCDKGGLFYERLRDLVGNGLATCPREDHRRQRRLIQPAFSPAQVAQYGTLMSDELAAMAGNWQPSQVIDVYPTMYGCALRIAFRALFSAHVDSEAVNEILRAANVVLSVTIRRMLLPKWLRTFPTRGNRRYERARRFLFDSVDAIIAAYRADQHDGGDRKDLLSLLMFATEGSEAGLDDSELRDQVIVMLLGASETTGAAITWALHLLSEHQDAQRRVCEEVDHVLAGRPADWADLPSLPFTGRVLTEALRRYPPGWMFTRITTTDLELAGRHIPTGTNLVFAPIAMHHDQGVYPRAEVFDPDRWLSEAEPAPPRGAFLAFGSGPRKCIGDRFGMAEGTLALATIATRWRVRPAPGSDPRPVPLTTILHPKSLLLELTERS